MLPQSYENKLKPEILESLAPPLKRQLTQSLGFYYDRYESEGEGNKYLEALRVIQENAVKIQLGISHSAIESQIDGFRVLFYYTRDAFSGQELHIYLPEKPEPLKTKITLMFDRLEWIKNGKTENLCIPCSNFHLGYGMEVEFKTVDDPDKRCELLEKLNGSKRYNTATADFGIDGSGDPLELRNIHANTPGEMAALYDTRLRKFFSTIQDMEKKYPGFKAGTSLDCCGLHVHVFRDSREKQAAMMNAHTAVACLVNAFNLPIWMSRLLSGYGDPFNVRGNVPWCKGGNGLELRMFNPIHPETLHFALDWTEKIAARWKGKALSDDFARMQRLVLPAKTENAVAINTVLGWFIMSEVLTMADVKSMYSWLSKNYRDFDMDKESSVNGPAILNLRQIEESARAFKTATPKLPEIELLCHYVNYAAERKNNKIGVPEFTLNKSVFAGHLKSCYRCRIITAMLDRMGHKMKFGTLGGEAWFGFIRTEAEAERHRSVRNTRDQINAYLGTPERPRTATARRDVSFQWTTYDNPRPTDFTVTTEPAEATPGSMLHAELADSMDTVAENEETDTAPF